MKIHVFLCSLFVFVTLARADPIRAKFLDNIDDNVIDRYEEIYDKLKLLNSLRFAKEIEAFPSGLHVYNDDGELVEMFPGTETVRRVKEPETEKISEKNVHFLLYTRKNPHDSQRLLLNDKKTLASSHFDPKKPTRFVTHGWINTANSPICVLIRDGYLKNDDVNVIIVDWSSYTIGLYTWASIHVPGIALQLSKMIDFLEDDGNLNINETTLVGHSLGAHVVGIAAHHAKGTINNIVGLDPALPMFAYAGPGSRISSEDANNVQIIHTNGGLLGYRDAIGHSDFYPNGGSKQSGCLMDVGGSCSHSRSYLLFAESINSATGFYGRPCDTYREFITGKCKTTSVALMGGSMIGSVPPGRYFLTTRPISLYAEGISN